MRRGGRRASPVAASPCADAAEVMVRRSGVASCVTCGLCGGFLRDATSIPECLHPFCRECIVEELTHKNINRCPKCDIDLGCNPLATLRADRSLQCIRSVIFPAKRRKVEELSPLHAAFVFLPSPSSGSHTVHHSDKKTDEYLMGEPMNAETETEEDKRLGTESSLSSSKPIASNPHTVVLGAGSAWLALLSANSGNWQGDEQQERTPLALSESGWSLGEVRGAMEGSGVELCAPTPKLAIQLVELKHEHHGLIDKQATAQERNTLAEEVDTLIVGVEETTTMATEPTLSTAVKDAAEESVALPLVASQSEAHEVELENTATVLGRVVTWAGRSQTIEAESTRLRVFRKFHNEREEMAPAAFERIRILEERLQRESEISQSNTRILERINASKEHATLQQSFNMREREKIALENQVDHPKISLAEEKHDTRVKDELRRKAVEEDKLKNKFENAMEQPAATPGYMHELGRTQWGDWVDSSHPYGQELQLSRREGVEEEEVVEDGNDDDDDDDEEQEEVEETVMVENGYNKEEREEVEKTMVVEDGGDDNEEERDDVEKIVVEEEDKEEEREEVEEIVMVEDNDQEIEVVDDSDEEEEREEVEIVVVEDDSDEEEEREEVEIVVVEDNSVEEEREVEEIEVVEDNSDEEEREEVKVEEVEEIVVVEVDDDKEEREEVKVKKVEERGDGRFAAASPAIVQELSAMFEQLRYIAASCGAGVIEIGVANSPIDMLMASIDCQIRKLRAQADKYGVPRWEGQVTRIEGWK